MDRQWRRTENAIWEAFGRLLTKKQYRNLTINDLIEEADIGRSTFYTHYAAKDELLESLCANIFPHTHPKVMSDTRYHYNIGNDTGEMILLRGFYHIKAYKDIIGPLMNRHNHTYFFPYLRKEFQNTLPLILSRMSTPPKPEHQVLAKNLPDSLRQRVLEDVFITTVHWWVTQGMETDPEPESALDYYSRILQVLG